MTAVKPLGRFGAVQLDGQDNISTFTEKPLGDGAWINGGFFVCQPEVFDAIPDGDNVIFEQGPLNSLAQSGQLHAYKHTGFWRPMDTLRDKNDLTALWCAQNAPWKIWE